MRLGRYLRWYTKKIRGTDRRYCYIINGKKTRIAHRATVADEAVIQQCFVDKQYELAGQFAEYRDRILAYYKAIIATGAVPLIVDAGANIGAASLWYHATYPEAKIIAIEPAEDNVRILRQNCNDASFDVRAAAIGHEDGFAYLTDPGAGEHGYRTTKQNDNGYKVPVISLDTILSTKSARDYQPFILKVDIEGAEHQLFSGPCAAAACFPIVIIEPHDWLMPGQHTALNFFQFHVDGKRDFAYHLENVFSIDYSKLKNGP